MKILAVDFSASQRGAAVLEGGAVHESVETGGRNVNALALIETALREAKLEREKIECLALGLGPGSYTGIRAAIALAQGWQLATGVKILGIGSAKCIAAQAWAEGMSGEINVVIDAQRNEFYLARFELAGNEPTVTKPLRLAALDEIQRLERAGETLVGPDIARWFPNAKPVFPRAAVLARLASQRNDFTAGEKLEPVYLRETTFVKAPPLRVIS